MSKFRREDAPPTSQHSKQDSAFLSNGKQAVLQALEMMLSAHRPACLPSNPADYMVDYLFEQPQPGESIRALPSGDFVTPYRDRMISLCRKFMALDDFDQRAVLAYREDGIFWRGDSIEFMGLIATEKSKGTKADLRRAGVDALKALVARGAA